MDEVAQSLLENIPVGGELKDPREGDHEGTLAKVELKTFDSGAVALRATFVGMIDSEGRAFEFTESIFIPTSEGSDGYKRMFLRTLHDLTLVERNDKRSRVADTDEHREAIRAAAEGLVGVAFPIRIKSDAEGDLRLQFRRVRK